jgi:hypothetical protein
MIWIFTDPKTRETVRSTQPPSQYVPREPIRMPRPIRNSSPHRPTTRNGAVLNLQTDDYD